MTEEKLSPQLEPGNIVRLKSGGPKMTVLEGDNTKGKVTCQWFDRNGKLHKNDFTTALLDIFIPSAQQG